MCKYCKLKEIGKNEYSNENPTIGKLKDGSQSYEIWLSRYISESDNVHRGELIMVHMFECLGSFYDEIVKQKSIEINYCPFCGEKL